jgi:hypothetical protein
VLQLALPTASCNAACWTAQPHADSYRSATQQRAGLDSVTARVAWLLLMLLQVEAFDTSVNLYGQFAFLLWRSVYITKQVGV